MKNTQEALSLSASLSEIHRQINDAGARARWNQCGVIIQYNLADSRRARLFLCVFV